MSDPGPKKIVLVGMTVDEILKSPAGLEAVHAVSAHRSFSSDPQTVAWERAAAFLNVLTKPGADVRLIVEKPDE